MVANIAQTLEIKPVFSWWDRRWQQKAVESGSLLRRYSAYCSQTNERLLRHAGGRFAESWQKGRQVGIFNTEWRLSRSPAAEEKFTTYLRAYQVKHYHSYPERMKKNIAEPSGARTEGQPARPWSWVVGNIWRASLVETSMSRCRSREIRRHQRNANKGQKGVP